MLPLNKIIDVADFEKCTRSEARGIDESGFVLSGHEGVSADKKEVERTFSHTPHCRIKMQQSIVFYLMVSDHPRFVRLCLRFLKELL